MAILLSTATGKTAETNKDTLRRLAADKGDKIQFAPVAGPWAKHDVVLLNGKSVGQLFNSHEDTIKWLVGQTKVRQKIRAVGRKTKHRKR